MPNRFEFVPGSVAYRNTWKNGNGHLRVNFYMTEERARFSAANSPTAMFQEIATEVHQSHCLLPGGQRYYA